MDGIPVSFSTIVGNKGPGVANSPDVLGSNIAFNEGPGALNSVVSNSYLKGNRGGDAIGSTVTFPSAEPRTEAPPFLMRVLPDEEFPIGVGSAGFEVTFSADMNTARVPEVSFGQAAPYTLYILSASPGWTDNRTWRGAFLVTNEIPDGTHTLRVARAQSAEGFLIPPDTYHRFRVDKQSGLSLSNGRVIAQTAQTLTLGWEPSTEEGILGYRIVRSRLSSGPYRAVGEAIAPATGFVDTGLEPETLYFYQIYEYYDSQQNRQLTRPIHGATLAGFDPTPTPSPGTGLTPTPSFTPTPRFNHDLWPPGGDGQLDARDLLEMLGGGDPDPMAFFDFAAYWRMEGGK